MSDNAPVPYPVPLQAPIPATIPRSVVMIGLMGAGKSCIGKRLAARLGLPFVDADAEIEAAAGRTIAEIFAEHGEDYFRRGERQVIERLLAGPVGVLATGGGAFMNSTTRASIRAHGLSLWLRAELDVLLNRVVGRTHRPLLRQGDPKATLQRLMAERYPVYAEADIIVDSRDEPADRTVDNALAALLAHLSKESLS